MELIGLAVLAVVGFVAAIVRPLLTDECKAWLPRLIDHLINRAVNLLPAEKRDRYHEEWRSHINELPGDVSRVLDALRFSIAARHMSPKPLEKRLMLKAILDKSIAFAVILISAPLFGLLAALIKLDSPGPVFSIQQHFGFNKNDNQDT
jgi:hypothetical protein